MIAVKAIGLAVFLFMFQMAGRGKAATNPQTGSAIYSQEAK